MALRSTDPTGRGIVLEEPDQSADDLRVEFHDDHPPSDTSRVVRRHRAFGLMLAGSDALCLLGALVISYAIRFDLGSMHPSYLAVVVLAPFTWVAVFFSFGLHSTHHLSASDEFRRTISATSVGIVVVIMASYWSNSSLSRGWLGLTLLFALVFELASRRGWRWAMARMRRSGHLVFRTLIVGNNDEAGRLAHCLLKEGTGYQPVGYVATGNRLDSANGLAVLGDVQEITQVIREHEIDCLFIASSATSPSEVMRVANAARHHGSEVRISANIPEILTSRLTVQNTGEVMALAVRPVHLTGLQAGSKRVFDVLVSGALLIVFSPVIAAVAIGVKLTSRGPALFRQARITRGGRTFNMMKFRTMVPNAETALGTGAVEISAPFFKMDDDPRLTPLGRFLRRCSLDELPQLWNVFAGDMSLVGPRPLPAEQVAANYEMLSPRHEVPAGVTGWWQINGRSNVKADDALRLDLFYIENWSLALDLYILAKTFGTVLTGRGAK